MNITTRWKCVGALGLTIALAACGGGNGGSSVATTAPVDRPALQVAGPQPSTSTRMICADEGEGDIASTVGTKPIRPVVGRWTVRDHVYTCDYVYSGGRAMTLSVKELSSAAETTSYFDALGVRLGRMHALQGLGQGAYQTKNGSTVVRKDNLVLLVDVTRLGTHFGTPLSPRADVSLSVAATIMGCWTGA